METLFTHNKSCLANRGSRLSAISVLLIYYPPENSIKSEKYVENISIKNSPLPPLVMDSKPIDYYGLTDK